MNYDDSRGIPTSPTPASNFASITEDWSTVSSAFQRQCAAARYRLLELQNRLGGLMLEVGSGSGIGLAKLAARGHRIVGVEPDFKNIARALSRGVGRLVRGSAEVLPIKNDAVSVAALLEVIYYLDDPAVVLAELARVTEPSGKIIISWPDPRRPGFIPSPLATRYPLPETVIDYLAPWCDSVQLFGLVDKRLSSTELWARTLASRLHLIPRSLERRGRLKRILRQGRFPIGSFEIAEAPQLIEVSRHETGLAMLYAVGNVLR